MMDTPVDLSDSSLNDPADPLSRLAVQHHAKWGTNRYPPHYHQRFAPFRDKQVKVLEIGIGGYEDPSAGGNSLRMWRDYFPKGTIVGLDVFDKLALSEDRIVIEQGDQSDPILLERLATKHGPFDIVIDDGSHKIPHVRQSFISLLPHVKDGGWYVIEDLHTSYWEMFGGSSKPGARVTTVDLLREIIDHLHYAEFDVVGYTPSELDRSIVALELPMRNIAFIRKGRNDEPSKLLGFHPHDKLFFAEENKDPQGGLLRKLRSKLPKALKQWIKSRMR